MRILALNPGSTAIKLAVFVDGERVWDYVTPHAQLDEVLRECDFANTAWDAVAARGGLLRPLRSGTYRINERMLDDLAAATRGRHASNLGAGIAHELATRSNCLAVIVDPVSVDEWADEARLSGMSGLDRVCLSHALNTKAIAKSHAHTLGTHYEALNLIVAHLGSGISVSAHRRGRMIDVNNSAEEGPFSTERTGSLPVQAVLKRAIREQWTEADVERLIFREGGLYSYLQEKDIRSVDVDHPVMQAMIYQIAKEIGAMGAALCGDVDAILITGGMAHSAALVESIAQRVRWMAPVVTYPGEDELRALAEGAARVLRGEEPLLEY